jgi:hypothetical protein
MVRSARAGGSGHLDASSSRRDHQNVRRSAVVAARLAVWATAALPVDRRGIEPDRRSRRRARSRQRDLPVLCARL